MISSQTVHDCLRRAFAPTPRGIVGLTEQLLGVCVGGDVAFERIGDRCVCRWSVSGETQEATVPLPPAAFRTLLARIAVLCNERSPNSVTPYGGEGQLIVKGDPPTVVQVAFVNTPDKQQLELRSSGAEALDAVEKKPVVEKARAFETALAAFRSGKQESLATILQVGYDFLHSRRGTWLTEVRRLGQLEEDDVIMDVVASLPSRIGRFAGNDIDAFHRWLAMVARHRVIDLVRREVRHKHELLKDTPDPEMPSPSEPLVAQEAVDRLLAAISDLPTDYRTIFALRLSGMSVSEISDLLGIPPSVTAARFYRLLSKLRDQFAAHVDK